MKHTKGPWQVSSWYSEAGRSCGVSNGIQGVAGVYGMGRDEAEANARLIAAAPELLEALARLVGHCYPEFDEPLFAAAVDRSRAAIAKATGEKQ